MRNAYIISRTPLEDRKTGIIWLRKGSNGASL
jgi:hypothetical protein